MEPHKDIIAPKYREIKENEVYCPLYKDIIPVKECKKCKNFIKIEDNYVLCALAWE
ncbi:MAG: hypothetical protein RXP98_03800 [Thermoplasmata archaeon]|jgi:hypothetical protein|nr:hypothetical protein [Euryarchaeota archaeon]